MSIVQLQIGKAYNAITATTVDITVRGGIALVIAGCSMARGIMQLIRNGGFELTAQRIERNVREELYVSLLGKSMTFHNLQPIGDTMARATNDVRQVNFLVQPGAQPGDRVVQLPGDALDRCTFHSPQSLPDPSDLHCAVLSGTVGIFAHIESNRR